jgi:glycosyltransferase involved in cell wall biosynthesis
VKIAQVLCAAGPVDAVTTQALAWRAVFERWSWSSEIYSARPPIDMPRAKIRPLRRFTPDGETVLVHYSGYARGLERIFHAPARTLLLSHNITPEDWFWPHDPADGVRCRLGREQLHDLALLADRLGGVSAFNAQELSQASGREADVIPVLFDRARLGAARTQTHERGSPTILFVGRLAPHKRQDLVIRAFARFRRWEPSARLVLVGTPMPRTYDGLLAELAQELAPGAVRFDSGVSQTELADRYRSADVFLCLSEHEGFCIPLLEAFHFGVPVVARAATAIPEVVGDAGVLLSAEDDLATVAEALRIVSGDEELRAELRRRGEQRLAAFDPARTAETMRRVLTDLAGT